MVQAIAKFAEIAKEAIANIEECQISASMIEDMKDIIQNASETASKSEIGIEKEQLEGVKGEKTSNEISESQLDARSTFIKNGHSFETDDRGVIYKKDGELIPGVEYTSNGGTYRVNESGDIETIKEGYYSSYDERLGNTPLSGERGEWSGKRGESLYKPNAETERGSKASEKLSEYGLDGIEYKDANPDFSKCSEETVEIDMTENRYSNEAEGIVGNFEKADTACAQTWNDIGKDGKSNWTAQDVADYREKNKLSWHECLDRKTCQLVSQDIHGYFGHSGGVSECKKALGETLGGGFDA